jgi:IclR family acetate operon transcriptional repressor
MDVKPSPDDRSAGAKTLSVLRALGEHDRIVDIAESTGLAKSTVHRILQTAVRQGFARVTGGGTYLVGPQVLALAGQLMSRLDPAQQAGAELRRLQERTGCTVHYALRDGDEAYYVAKVESRKPYRLASRVGMTLRLHTTSIGKAILAELPDAEARALLRRTGLARHTSATVVDEDVLLGQLREIRRLGYAVDDEENETGVRCVGAVVRDHLGTPVGAISVSYLAGDPEQPPVPELGRLVTGTAAAVSAGLGHRPDGARGPGGVRGPGAGAAAPATDVSRS